MNCRFWQIRILTSMCVVALCTLMLSLASCSSSDELTFDVSTGTADGNYKCGLDGGLYEIKINSSSNWEAAMSSGAEEWIGLSEMKGNRPGTILLSVDPNFTEIGRTGVVTLMSGGQERKITIIQGPSPDGVELGNSNIENVKIAFTKGVGMGFDLLSAKSTYPIINSKAVEWLVKYDDVEYGSLFNYDDSQELRVEDVMIDSVETKRDTLGVMAQFEVGYAFFKLKGEGSYTSDEARYDSSLVFNFSANYPAVKARTSCYEAIIINRDAEKRAAEAELDNVGMREKSILTNAFCTKRDKVIDAYSKGTHNYTTNVELSNSLRDLVNYFGPVVTNSSTLGGNISIHLEVDTSRVSEVSGIPKAQISAAINAFILRIEGNVSVEIMKTSTSTMRNSNYTFAINGGSNSKMSAIVAALRESRYDDVRDAVGEWARSINTSSDIMENNVEIISSQLCPIWRFFPNGVQDAVREYVLATYADPMGILKNL